MLLPAPILNQGHDGLDQSQDHKANQGKNWQNVDRDKTFAAINGPYRNTAADKDDPENRICREHRP